MRKTSHILLTLVACLHASAAVACSCAEYLVGAHEALEKSALVFSGEVVSVRIIELPRIVFTQNGQGEFIASQYLDRRGIYTFRVIQSWKGESAQEYTVMAGAPPEQPLAAGQVIVDCDVHFEKGSRYLVFTTAGYAEANVCAPTGTLSEREQIVRELNDLRVHGRKKAPPNSR